MHLYTMVGAGIGSHAATALSTRLAAWHDAMVTHERKIRAGRTGEACDDECAHAEARALWIEAVETFGDRAQELTFLRTRAIAASARSRTGGMSTDVAPGAADPGPPPDDSGADALDRPSQVRVRSSERSRTAAAEL